MPPDPSPHVSDPDLIRAADGEVSPSERTRIAGHLDACWTCRTRMKAFEEAIGDFVAAYHDGTEASFPTPAPRIGDRVRWRRLAGRTLAALSLVAALSLLALNREARELPDAAGAPLLRPDPELTLGATVGVSANDVCTDRESGGAPIVPVTVGRDVFAEYGIRDAHERPYELDYLIPPELGGSGDIQNLWPQAYTTPVWNAHVKDALEDHLHRLVCRGEIGLAMAQMEISRDWIAAYRKYFDTEFPVSDHLAFLKDEPWTH